MLFTELNLNPSVMRGIEDAGFTECTPVQAATFQKSLAGTDVMVQSQTGTGKTAAFLITIFNLFLTGEKYRHKKALVLTPTRELAVQVEQDAQVLGKHCGLKIGCFYGGMGYATQDQLLRQDISLFIGTPGRLIDYQKSGKIDFLKFEILVIDEADRMFDMGFIPDIRYMLKRMVPADRRLTMLYSATLDQRVKHLAWEYMNEPVEIEINPEHLAVDLITQELYHVGRDEKFNLLLGILRAEKPESVLIFTNMKRTAERVSRRLSANGVKNDYISGDLPQKKRLKIIDAIKEGKTEILVATDVAGRGLHIEDLDMVINYDLPQDNQNYVHRIGRTARAGKTGKAISLVSEEDVFNLEPIEKLLGEKIPVKWADENLIVEASGAPIHGRREPRRDQRGGRRSERPGERRRDRQDRKRPEGRRDHARPQGASVSAGAQRQEQAREAGEARRQPSGGEPRREQRHQAHPMRSQSAEKPADNAASQPDKKRRRRRRGRKPEAGTASAPRPVQSKPGQESRTVNKPDKRSDRRPDKRRSGVPKDATPEERLEYFRKKYGDNFEKTGKIIGGDQKTKPPTLVQGIKSMFDRMRKKND